MGRCAVWVVLGVAVTGGSLLAGGCSLLLDFDVGAGRDGGVDAAPGSDGGGGGPDAANFCGQMEPNNTRETATPLTPGSYPELAICPGNDHDFFGFALDGAQDVVIAISFENMGGAGDLEMRLFAEGVVNPIAQSNGFADSERIERSTAMGGQLPAANYVVEVYGFNSQVQNNYVLELTITP